MKKNELEIKLFRFDSKMDYLPYFETHTISFKENETLKDLLEMLKNSDHKEREPLSVDTSHIALRINNIVVFENLKISNIKEHFGDEIEITPMNKRYILRDLVMDKKAILARYNAFFSSATFITPSEKDELEKYLMINFISPLYANTSLGDEYFGDGFFLYIKWLMSRYPSQIKHFIKMLSDVNGGVMNFISVAQDVYPIAIDIDNEIRGIQQSLTLGSKCPITGSRWKNLCKSLEQKMISL